MEFIFETNYDQKGISAMAEALRKTIRKKKSKRSHILAILIIIFALLISLPQKDEQFVIETNTIITWTAVLIMILVLIFEDKINGYIARKRMLSGMEKAVTVFKEDVYISTTNLGKTEFYYKNRNEIAETEDYFVFIFDKSHAQIYDKNGITKGTIDEFREFIAKKTEKEVQKI